MPQSARSDRSRGSSYGTSPALGAVGSCLRHPRSRDTLGAGVVFILSLAPYLRGGALRAALRAVLVGLRLRGFGSDRFERPLQQVSGYAGDTMPALRQHGADPHRTVP
jgi:hypothetical protein